VGHPELIGELQKTREPFNVNMLSQVAAMACIDNWDEVPGRALRNRQQLEWMTEQLNGLGLEVVPSQTNFLLVRTPRDAGKMTDDLLHKGVIVRPMQAFGLGDGALRISIGLPAENQRCIEALKEIMS
jgi:histidinol-phosphate aminotransferase